jgi:DNA helicase-2/ATP-dependent DNA helicase PcrA
VAITRAEEHCFLSFARSRFKYGKMEFGTPSRFLKEIDCQLMLRPQQPAAQCSQFASERPQFAAERPRFAQPQRLKPLSAAASSAPSASSATAPIHAGQSILHERFGRGVIVNVAGVGENMKATVRFENAGEKQLLMKFARFNIIE